MKRISIVVLLTCWLLLLGYALARVPSSPAPALADATVTPLIPGPYPTPRVPNELTYYTKRCWPACHYDSSWLSDEPDRLVEEFEGSLGSEWTWLNENESLWSLEDSPGAVRIVAPGGSTREAGGGLKDVINVLAHEAPAEHFDILTRVTFDAGGDGQNAGLFLQLHDGAVIWLGRGMCDEGELEGCPGDGVIFDALGADCRYQGAPLPSDTVDLMLRRAGNSYIGYYHVSEAGETVMPTHMGWVEVGRCYRPGAIPQRVGLAVNNSGPGGEAVSAGFDVATLVQRK